MRRSVRQWKRRAIGGGEGREKNNLSPPLNVHHVSWLLLGFLFWLAESPALAVAASSVPWRQREGLYPSFSLSLSLPVSLYSSFSLFSSPLCLSLSLSVCHCAQLYSGPTFCRLGIRCMADLPTCGAQLGDWQLSASVMHRKTQERTCTCQHQACFPVLNSITSWPPWGKHLTLRMCE